jgi:signal transduction histidine kinase
MAKTIEDFNALSRRMLKYAGRGVLRVDFLKTLSEMLIDFSLCDAIELRIKERNRFFRFEAVKNETLEFQLNVGMDYFYQPASLIPPAGDSCDLDELCRYLVGENIKNSAPFITPKGSFWTGNTGASFAIKDVEGQEKVLDLGNKYKSIAIIPFGMETKESGFLILKSRRERFCTEEEIIYFEGVAQNIGVALMYRYAQVALRERVKELTCLYGIAKIVARPDISVDEILQEIVELLPPAWLYPEIATARIIFDGKEYLAPHFNSGSSILASDIYVNESNRGRVEVIYCEERPLLDEGPFLFEERKLIDTVAQEIALSIERRQVEEDKNRLQEQLRHADRLATIGQLAAGVAHELNEPLGSILGFAQLARKSSNLSDEASRDLQKIISASLHAREIIKKLMVFARQMPPRKTQVNLNQVIDEGLYFLESRCAKAGIELVRKFAGDLPEIIADPSQLHQVLVNLIVNSIQAMPSGGKIILETFTQNGSVVMVVQDTGIGMNNDVLRKIFVPFFTTKDVHEGTGLGLPVVHGIITGHGGIIKVESKVGVGTKFEIQLPIRAANGLKEIEENGGIGQ